MGHVTKNEFIDYRYGIVTQAKDANGNRTYVTLDEFGRVIQQDYPDGGQILTDYFDSVFPRYTKTRTLISSGNYATSYEFKDGFGRTIQTAVQDATGYLITRTFYDGMGRVESSWGPFHDHTYTYPATPWLEYPGSTTTYDDRGRVVSTVMTDGATKTYTYSGLETTITDPDGKKKTEIRDYKGRVLEIVEDPDDFNYHTYYEYDAFDNPTKITDHLGNETVMVYDTLCRKIQMTDPNMGTWHYDYDANGNQIMETDAKGQMKVMEYDGLNRLESKTFVNTDDNPVYYTYDDASCPNGVGMLYLESNGVVTSTVQAYDAMGRVLASTKEIQGAAYNPTSYLYDLAGNLTNIYYPDGYPVAYTYYPGTSLPYQVIGQLGATLATFSGYAPNGSPCRIDYDNGAYTDQVFDGQTLRLESIVTTDANSEPVQNFSYSYTLTGNLATKVDSRLPQSVAYTYTYDNLHRLTRETGTDGTNRCIGYDAIGNIQAQVDNGESLVYGYGGAGNNQPLISIHRGGGPFYYYEHDNNGNMTQGWDFSGLYNPVARTVQYDGYDMPVSITLGNDTTLFAYDGNGTRAVMEVAGGDLTHYVTASYEVLNGAPVKYISGCGMTIAKIDENGVMTYMHQDHLGSSTASTDALGVRLGGMDYRPFGLENSSWGTFTDKYRYTGQEKDFSTGLYNYDARLYDPIIGRFISADTIIPDLLNPQSLNRYAYCLNNPLAYTDPTGHNGIPYSSPWGTTLWAYGDPLNTWADFAYRWDYEIDVYRAGSWETAEKHPNLYAIENTGYSFVQPLASFLKLGSSFGEHGWKVDSLMEIVYGCDAFVTVGAAIEGPLSKGLSNLGNSQFGNSVGSRLARLFADETGAVGSWGPKSGADFIVSENGTAVHASQSKMIESITNSGATKIGPTHATTESGQIFHMNTSSGPIEARVMNGRPGGGPNQGPRTIVTRPGTREYVHPNGARIEGPVPLNQRKAIGHIHGQTF